MRDNNGRGFSWGRRFAAGMMLAAAFALPGCSKKDKKPDETNVPTPTKEIVATGPLDKLTAPAEILLFGGADSPEGMIKAFAGMMGPAGAALNPAMAAGGLEQSFKLRAGAIDFAKPVRLAVANPKAHPEPMIVAVTAKGGRAEFEKALPPDHKKDDAGNAFSYAISKTTYVNFVDDFAVLTNDKDLFPKNRDFIKQLLGAKVDGQAAMAVSMKNITDAFGKEIDAAVEQSKHLPQREGTPGANPEQLAAIMDGTVAFFRSMDTVAISATMPEGGAILTIDCRPKAGSDLAKEVGELHAGKMGLLGKLPKDTAFVGTVTMDADHPSPLFSKLITFSMRSTFPAGAEKMAEAMDAWMKATTGEFTMAGYKQAGSDDLTIVSLTGVRDAPTLKKAWDDLHDLYKDPKLAEGLKRLGMAVEIKKDAYKIGKVSVSTQETKLDPKSPLAAQTAKMQGFLAPFLSTHYALTDDMAIVAMGKNAKSALEAWIGGKVEGGFDQTPAFAKAKAHAAENAGFLMWGSVRGIAAAFGAPGASALGAIGDSGVAMSLGAKDGAVRLVFDLPADQLQAIIQLGSQLKGMR